LRAILSPENVVGDLFVLIYLSVLPSIALVIGGAASRSPFGAIVAGREMSMILSYEAAFLASIFVVLIKTHSILFSDIIAYQTINGPIIFSISGVIAFVVAMFAMQAKLGYLPFDIAEAETELIGGPLAEYSGSGLALFRISRAMAFVYLPAWLTLMFLGGVEATAVSLLGFLLKFLAILTVSIVVKITHARLKLDQALRLFWGKILIASLVAIILALFGL